MKREVLDGAGGGLGDGGSVDHQADPNRPHKLFMELSLIDETIST